MVVEIVAGESVVKLGRTVGIDQSFSNSETLPFNFAFDHINYCVRNNDTVHTIYTH